jgi:hypothetical protein
MSMLGTEAKIAVLPIEMSVSTTDDKILSANKPTSPTLLATDFLIALNKTEAQAEIDKLIPVEKVTTTDTKADIEKQKELENKVKELEEQRKALRSEDGSIPADKMSEFKRLGEEINKAKKAATRGYSDNSMLIKRFSEGADTSVTDPKILSAEDKKEAADIIEQVIQNSKTAEEALKKIQRLGYIFDISVTQNLKKYLDDRFDQNVPKIGNNKDSFQAWIYGKTDAELAALETNIVPADAESSDDVESPAVEAEVKEREVVVIDESVRYKISDFKADLDKVTTKEELNNLLADLSIKNSEQLISYEDLQEMATMVKEKANQLNTPQDIKIVPESLAPGTELVAKNTIFVSGVNVQVDETVVVKSVNASNNTIVVTPLNSTSSVTLTFSTLNQSFTLKDAVMNATEIEEEKVTPEDKIKIVESTDLVDTFVQNKTGRIDQIEETASAKSLEELDEELMDDLEC